MGQGWGSWRRLGAWDRGQSVKIHSFGCPDPTAIETLWSERFTALVGMFQAGEQPWVLGVEMPYLGPELLPCSSMTFRAATLPARALFVFSVLRRAGLGRAPSWLSWTCLPGFFLSSPVYTPASPHWSPHPCSPSVAHFSADLALFCPALHHSRGPYFTYGLCHSRPVTSFPDLP